MKKPKEKTFSLNHNFPPTKNEVYFSFIYVDIPEEKGLRDYFRDRLYTFYYMKKTGRQWENPQIFIDHGPYNKHANKLPVFVYGVDMTDPCTYFRVRIGAYSEEDLKRISVWISKIEVELNPETEKMYYRITFSYDVKRKPRNHGVRKNGK